MAIVIDLKFEEWLGAQQWRKDLIGDFAPVVHIKKIDPTPVRFKTNEHKIWADIVVGLDVSEDYAAVFNVAWQEFLLARQMAQGLSDKLRP